MVVQVHQWLQVNVAEVEPQSCGQEEGEEEAGPEHSWQHLVGEEEGRQCHWEEEVVVEQLWRHREEAEEAEASLFGPPLPGLWPWISGHWL